MPLPITIPNTFANATATIPLSQLDNNFSTVAVAVNSIGNGAFTLANAQITGGTISNVTLDNVSVDVETLSNVTITNLTVDGNATFTNAAVTANVATITTANVTTANVTNLVTGNATITGGTINVASVIATDDVTVGDDLVFTGTGNRITGDFSNATVANRVMFQTSTVDGATQLNFVPNGTATTAGIFFRNSSSTVDGGQFLVRILSTEAQLSSTNYGAGTTLPMTFYTGGSERMRIDTSGYILPAQSNAYTTSPFNAYPFQLSGGAFGGNSGIALTRWVNTVGAQAAIFMKSRGTTVGDHTIVQSGDSLGSMLFYGSDGTGPVNAASIIAAVDGTPGTNDMPGRLVFNTTADGSASATERARINSSGDFFLGKSTASITVAGGWLRANGQAYFTVNSDDVIICNRLGNDGKLIRFFQADVEEGDISVSGTTVSYNGGHLSRWAQMLTKPDLLKGTVMSNLDEMNKYFDADGNPVPNEQLNKVKVSDVEGDVNVAGVFVNWTHDEAHDVDEINMAMTGDMIIRIAQGVVVQRGDLLMSAGDGTAKPQGDDIVRSKTVAKVTSNHVTCTYEDGSYCVPCVLMAC